MKNYLPVLLFITICFCACSKEKVTEVWVRMANRTTETLRNAQSHGVDFGTIDPGDVTEYKVITQPIYDPGCTYTISGKLTGSGILMCLTPLPPAYSAGRYTFSVKPTDYPSVYWTEVKKE